MSDRLKVNIFAFITVLFWGSGFPFTRIIGDQISSFNLGFIRCALAAAVLLAIGLATGIKRPRSLKDCGWFALAGATGFSVYFILFNLGLLTLNSSEGSVICATSPIITAVLVFYIYKEKINILGWCMILTAFIGVVLLLFWDSLFGDSQCLAGGIGALWMFLCAAVFALYNVLNRVLGNKGYSAMEIVTWSAVFGALEMIVFLPGTISEMAAATAGANLAALYLGLFPSAVSYYFWSKAITLAKRTSEATNYLFINPLIASVIALIMLREIPGAGTFLGGIIIVASVIVFSTRGGK